MESLLSRFNSVADKEEDVTLKRKIVDEQESEPKKKKLKVRVSSFLHKHKTSESIQRVSDSLKAVKVKNEKSQEVSVLYYEYMRGVLGNKAIERLCIKAGLRDNPDSKKWMNVSALAKDQLRIIQQVLINWRLIDSFEEAKIAKRKSMSKEHSDSSISKIKCNLF
jgi:hypothetical protein